MVGGERHSYSCLQVLVVEEKYVLLARVHSHLCSRNTAKPAETNCSVVGFLLWSACTRLSRRELSFGSDSLAVNLSHGHIDSTGGAPSLARSNEGIDCKLRYLKLPKPANLPPTQVSDDMTHGVSKVRGKKLLQPDSTNRAYAMALM